MTNMMKTRLIIGFLQIITLVTIAMKVPKVNLLFEGLATFEGSEASNLCPSPTNHTLLKILQTLQTRDSLEKKH